MQRVAAPEYRRPVPERVEADATVVVRGAAAPPRGRRLAVDSPQVAPRRHVHRGRRRLGADGKSRRVAVDVATYAEEEERKREARKAADARTKAAAELSPVAADAGRAAIVRARAA